MRDKIDLLRYAIAQQEGRNLKIAMHLAELSSKDSCPTDEEFARWANLANQEAWDYALAQSAFHRLHTSIETLKSIMEAFKIALIETHGNTARIAATIQTPHVDPGYLESLENQAAVNLLSLCAIHSAFIDSCRIARQRSNLDTDEGDRAIRKIISPYSRNHDFIRDLRNCILHHGLQKPKVSVRFERAGESNIMYLDRSELISLEYTWKTKSKDFLATHTGNEIQIIRIFEGALRNFVSQQKFVERAIRRRHRLASDRYESYCKLRENLFKSQSRRITEYRTKNKKRGLA